MKNYIIQRLDTGEYYHWRAYGNRWVKEQEKAKLFKRRGDAGNAINNMRACGLTANMRVFLVEVTVTYKANFFDYTYFPPINTSRIQ